MYFPLVVLAQKEKTWIEASLEAKLNLRANLAKAGVPISSPVMRSHEKAVPMSANIKGWDQLVLTASGTSDGTAQDWSAFVNARLIKEDGSVVWLDELEPAYQKTGYDQVYKNIGVFGNPLVIGGKKYDHGIFCHADALVIYNLDKKFVRFETEVGIVDKLTQGSVSFGILNNYPQQAAKELFRQYPHEIGVLATDADGLESWMVAQGEEAETQMIASLLSQLKDASYYKKELENLSGATAEERLRNAIRLYATVRAVLDIQKDLEWLNIEAIKLAFADMKKQPGYDVAKYEPLFNELLQLSQKGFDRMYLGDEKAIDNAQKALANKRAILLGNTLLDVDRVVASRYKLGAEARRAMSPSLGTQSNNWSNQSSAPRSGFNADIVELTNLRGDVCVRSVYAPANGSPVSDLKLHWDGDRVMFTQTEENKHWNVFEVKLDGTGLRPMVECPEPDIEFYDGTYLPDGRVIAVSNIGYQGVPCVSGSDAVGNMMLFDPKDKSLRRLTFDQDANWNPVITHSGKVMYTRWEYTDLTHYYTRIVMTMNPDGTEQRALYGSGSMFPNSTFDIQPLPGHSSAFVGIISGHHGVARSGRLILFDPTKHRKGAAGIIQEIPHRNRPVTEFVKDELVNGVWPQFVKPTPLSDKYFLVSAKLTPNDLWGLYLVDVYDNVTCLTKAEGEGYISPIVVRKTKTPPSIPDRVKLDEKEATFFIQDIYEGEGLKGIPRGTVKALRLHAYEYAYLKTTSDHNWHGIQSGWDIKRILGTVPVEEDGSVMFKAPANTPISIQPLDKDGVAVQWMRSWVTGQPGEIVSCVGCHESQNQVVIPKRVIASQKKPASLTLPEGGVRSFTFDLEVQPILDRACIACHNGEGKAFDLRGGKKDGQGYGTSYLNIHPYVHRQGGEGDMKVLYPYEYHPNTSELVRLLKKGHYNVELTDEEWKKLYNWIDYNAPDKGYFNANVVGKDVLPYQGFDQIKRRKELTDKYANGAGVDWQKEIADYAAYLKGKGPITPVMPEKRAEAEPKDVKAKDWPFDAAGARALLEKEGQTRKEVEIAPGIKVNFVRIPAGQFVMGSYSGEPDAYPTARVKIKKGFWMAELETTNEQFNAIFPEHDSRHMDQQWKDHVVPGYPANRPDQPVIRVSYDQAMEYCKQLSERTGLHITLPTEAQWEWACRAGSGDDFWYGGMHSDFGKKENLADKTTLQFAVIGIDPQPMDKSNYWYKHYTYLPKEESVDDGSLVQVGGKVYEANPFGLYNMHGNVAEWTRSDYVPYTGKGRKKNKSQSEYKVVRGGSFFDRPKYATSHTRKFYYPYQPVFNVGFRMIIED